MEIGLCGAADIGGTKIRVGIVGYDKTVLSSNCFPTPLGEGGAARAARMIVEDLKDQCGVLGIQIGKLTHIGLICAGPVDINARTIENPYTLSGWEGYPLAAEVEMLSGVDTHIENDANGALLGEVALSGYTGERVLMLTFGTGIGVAFWDGAKIYRSGDRFHPEMGHIIVSSEGEACYCGMKGCFENLCSGSALNKRAAQNGYADFDHLREMEDTDPAAAALLNKMRSEIGNGIWSLCSIFKPNVVILGGGLMQKHFAFGLQAVSGFSKGSEDFVGSFQVVQSSQSVDASLISSIII